MVFSPSGNTGPVFPFSSLMHQQLEATTGRENGGKQRKVFVLYRKQSWDESIYGLRQNCDWCQVTQQCKIAGCSVGFMETLWNQIYAAVTETRGYRCLVGWWFTKMSSMPVIRASQQQATRLSCHILWSCAP